VGTKRDNETSGSDAGLRITTTDERGKTVDAPEQVYRLTREVLSIVAEGGAAAVISVDHDLSTQAAADILGVSRPHLIKVLEQGDIPFYLVGRHRRVAVDDLLAYKQRRDAHRRGALDALAAESQDLGLY